MAETAQQATPPVPKSRKTEGERLLDRWASLDNAYTTWRPRHIEIIDNIQPDRGAFVGRDQPNRGTRKDHAILDSTATDADKKLAAAMDTGITSPAREWFRLTTTLGEDVAADYLHDVQTELFRIFAKSNIYTVLGNLYRDLVGPGTSLVFFEEDAKDVIRAIHIPIGQYRLATDARGRVDTAFRRFWMQTRAMVKEFGFENCSTTVQQQYEMEKYDEWHEIQHSVEPREERVYGKIDAKNKPWASCWVEVNSNDKNKLLRKSGFDKKPFAAARWDVVGQNAYGTDSPAMQCIGDVKQLQSFTMAAATAVALIVKPPMNQPAGLLNGSIVAGAKNPIPTNSQQKFEPSVVVHPQTITVIASEKAEVRQRIRGAYLNNLLFLLNGEYDPKIVAKTAFEIQARKDEALLQLSSAYKILSDEVLDTLIDLALFFAQKQGRIQQPPQDLHQPTPVGGVRAEVHVEYLNNLAAAQKLLGISAVERLINSAIGIFTGTQDRSVLDNIDFDQAIHLLAETLGVKPSLVRKEDVINAMRAQRQQQQQQQMAAQQAQQSAGALKDISQTDPEKLAQLGQQYGPYAQAQLRA